MIPTTTIGGVRNLCNFEIMCIVQTHAYKEKFKFLIKEGYPKACDCSNINYILLLSSKFIIFLLLFYLFCFLVVLQCYQTRHANYNRTNSHGITSRKNLLKLSTDILVSTLKNKKLAGSKRQKITERYFAYS